jgi:hypothetical protein
LAALEAHRLNHIVEQLSGLADEWLAGGVLVGTGTFADEHETGGGIAVAEDDLAAAGVGEGTTGAVAYLGLEGNKSGRTVGGWHSRRWEWGQVVEAEEFGHGRTELLWGRDDRERWRRFESTLDGEWSGRGFIRDGVAATVEVVDAEVAEVVDVGPQLIPVGIHRFIVPRGADERG